MIAADIKTHINSIFKFNMFEEHPCSLHLHAQTVDLTLGLTLLLVVVLCMTSTRYSILTTQS